MIRALVSILVLICASAAFADENCEKLVLKCYATYRASDGKAVMDETPAITFADEHWDEPSMANCAATAYTAERQGTIIRVYATKDLHSDLVTVSAQASQKVAGPNGTEYSKEISSMNTSDMVQNLGALTLEAPMNPIKLGKSEAREVIVGCIPLRAE